MALFKPFRGSRASLDAQPLHDGYAYFCLDDGTFHIDYIDDNGILQRKQINSKDTETFNEHGFDEFVLKVDVKQADWSQTDETKPDYIKNKPSHFIREAVTSIINGVLTLTQTYTYATSIVNGAFVLGYEGKLNTSVVDGVAITTQKGNDYLVSVANNALIVA